MAGFAKLKKSKWKWLGGSRIHLDKKGLENRPKIKFCLYTFHASIPVCILFVSTLLNVVSRYDLSVLSMSWVFKKWIGGGGCGVSSIQFLFGFLEFLALQSR